MQLARAIIKGTKYSRPPPVHPVARSADTVNAMLAYDDERGVRFLNMDEEGREAVSKVMSEFQRDGLVEVRNRKISISPRLAKIP